MSDRGTQFKSALFDDFKVKTGARISKRILQVKQIPKLPNHAAVKGKRSVLKPSEATGSFLTDGKERENRTTPTPTRRLGESQLG